ncbi:hypothetical protein VDGD_20160 [Verticillium dahliae]|nr:hypothetical protein VDGD_20160 [Verticillium dahliae]
MLFSKNARSASASAMRACSSPSRPPRLAHASSRWRIVLATPSATLPGIEMDGSACETRASEPSVDDARSRRSADRMRVSVDSRSGSEPVCGVPSRESRWPANVSIGCLRSALETRATAGGSACR